MFVAAFSEGDERVAKNLRKAYSALFEPLVREFQGLEDFLNDVILLIGPLSGIRLFVFALE